MATVSPLWLATTMCFSPPDNCGHLILVSRTSQPTLSPVSILSPSRENLWGCPRAGSRPQSSRPSVWTELSSSEQISFCGREATERGGGGHGGHAGTPEADPRQPHLHPFVEEGTMMPPASLLNLLRAFNEQTHVWCMDK